MAENTEAGEKTEEATPKRRDQAREKGQVAMSTEFVVALGLLSAILAATWVGPILVFKGQSMITLGIAEMGLSGAQEASSSEFVEAMRSVALMIVPAFLLFILPMYFITLASGYGQIGFRFSPKAISADLNKLNPIKGAQKIVGPRGWVKTGLAILKITLISTAVVSSVFVRRHEITTLTGMDLSIVLQRIVELMVQAALAGIAMALLIAVIDLAYQRMQHSKDLRMTKKEVKDEAKNTEGDPHVKARIRNIQREMSRKRMMDDVPEATVVVTNPTHFAVALKYDEAQPNRAPWVVAKGMDLIALNIRKIAAENGVPIIENPPLARGLHRIVEIGDEIPEDLFEAVAKVLAFVMRAGTSEPVAAGGME